MVDVYMGTVNAGFMRLKHLPIVSDPRRDGVDIDPAAATDFLKILSGTWPVTDAEKTIQATMRWISRTGGRNLFIKSMFEGRYAAASLLCDTHLTETALNTSSKFSINAGVDGGYTIGPPRASSGRGHGGASATRRPRRRKKNQRTRIYSDGGNHNHQYAQRSDNRERHHRDKRDNHGRDARYDGDGRHGCGGHHGNHGRDSQHGYHGRNRTPVLDDQERRKLLKELSSGMPKVLPRAFDDTSVGVQVTRTFAAVVAGNNQPDTAKPDTAAPDTAAPDTAKPDTAAAPAKQHKKEWGSSSEEDNT